MKRIAWTTILVLSSTAAILIAVAAATTSSSAAPGQHPKLTVESCLVEGSEVFRIRAVNWDVAGEWRLQLHQGTELIPLGYLEAWEQVGALDWTATITTTTEGTWRKQFLEGEEWIDSHGAHYLGVQVFTDNGWFCPPEPTFHLGDRVWYDTNQDGLQDEGEPGVQGVVVQLHEDGACGTTYTYSRTTNLYGGYLFTDLTTSTVCLQFVDVPAGWQISLQDQGSDETMDSDADPVSARIESIDVQGDDVDQDVGLYVEGSIGDRVWCDYDGDSFYDGGEGLGAITVSLLDDWGCDGVGGEVLSAVETSMEGHYTFSGLNTGPPGSTDEVCYVVAVDAADEDLNACSQPAGQTALGLILTAGEFLNEAIDFCFVEGSELPDDFRSFCPLVLGGG